MKLLPIFLILATAGCVTIVRPQECKVALNTPSPKAILDIKPESFRLDNPPPKCPCDGMPSCKCDRETGGYSYSDGCNTSHCDVTGVCTKTLLFCPPPDWRLK